MDISKASNFERFVFDALGRDAARTRALFDEVETRRAFSLTPAERERVAAFGFVSGRSTSADRVATIRDVHGRFGEVIDPHTADALKVARDERDPATPMIVFETALAAKFNATIRAAIGSDAPRPARLAGLEELPQRVVRMAADVERLKSFIAENDRR
jgi:threonine synthase